MVESIRTKLDLLLAAALEFRDHGRMSSKGMKIALGSQSPR